MRKEQDHVFVPMEQAVEPNPADRGGAGRSAVGIQWVRSHAAPKPPSHGGPGDRSEEDGAGHGPAEARTRQADRGRGKSEGASQASPQCQSAADGYGDPKEVRRWRHLQLLGSIDGVLQLRGDAKLPRHPAPGGKVERQV